MFKLLTSLLASICVLSSAIASEEPKTESCNVINYRFYATVDVGGSEGMYPYKNNNYAASTGFVAAYDTGNMSFNTQIEARHEGGLVERNPRVIYGFVDFKNSDFDQDDHYGVRIGRVQLQNGFDNRVRNLPWLSPWISNPFSTSREQFRYFSQSGDGVQIYDKHEFENGYSAVIEAGFTRPIFLPNKEVEYTIVGDPELVSFESKKSALKAINFGLVNPDRTWQYRLDYNDLNFHENSKFISSGVMGSAIYTGSIRHVVGRNIITLQALKATTYGDPWRDYDKLYGSYGDSWGYNIALTHRAENGAEYSIFYDYFCTFSNDCNGRKVSAASGAPEYMFYERSFAVAYKRYLSNNFTMHLQYTKGTGLATQSYANMRDGDSGDKQWQMLQARFTYFF